MDTHSGFNAFNIDAKKKGDKDSSLFEIAKGPTQLLGKTAPTTNIAADKPTLFSSGNLFPATLFSEEQKTNQASANATSGSSAFSLSSFNSQPSALRVGNITTESRAPLIESTIPPTNKLVTAWANADKDKIIPSTAKVPTLEKFEPPKIQEEAKATFQSPVSLHTYDMSSLPSSQKKCPSQSELDKYAQSFTAETLFRKFENMNILPEEIRGHFGKVAERFDELTEQLGAEGGEVQKYEQDLEDSLGMALKLQVLLNEAKAVVSKKQEMANGRKTRDVLNSKAKNNRRDFIRT